MSGPIYSSTSIDELLERFELHDIEAAGALRSRISDMSDSAAAYDELWNDSTTGDVAQDIKDLVKEVETLEAKVDELEEELDNKWQEGWDAAVEAAGLDA